MRELVRTSATWVWLLLMAATGFSMWTAVEHGIDDRVLATVVVMVVAFLKVRFVGLHFMELRHAPPLLRLAFHGWYTGSCALVLAMYLGGS